MLLCPRWLSGMHLSLGSSSECYFSMTLYMFHSVCKFMIHCYMYYICLRTRFMSGMQQRQLKLLSKLEMMREFDCKLWNDDNLTVARIKYISLCNL